MTHDTSAIVSFVIFQHPLNTVVGFMTFTPSTSPSYLTFFTGLPSRCTRRCLLMLLCTENFLPHPSSVHTNGFSPVCEYVWMRNELGRLNLLEQYGHWYLFVVDDWVEVADGSSSDFGDPRRFDWAMSDEERSIRGIAWAAERGVRWYGESADDCNGWEEYRCNDAYWCDCVKSGCWVMDVESGDGARGVRRACVYNWVAALFIYE